MPDMMIWIIIAGVLGIIYIILNVVRRSKEKKCREFGHDWDGCKCERCGQTRDEAHDWDGCTCRKCGLEQHDWEYHSCYLKSGGSMIADNRLDFDPYYYVYKCSRCDKRENRDE